MSTDFRGDPSAALLEVLDPEQNSDLQRSLPGSRLRPVGRHVHHDGQLPAGHPDAAAGPHGDHPAARLHRVREGLDRRALPDPQADAATTASASVDRRVRPRTRSATSSTTTRRRRASATSSARSRPSAARSPRRRRQDPRRSRVAGKVDAQAAGQVPGAAPLPLRAARRCRTRSAWSTGLAVTMHGGDLLATEVSIVSGKGKLVLTGKLGRRHAGVGAGGDQLRALARARRWGWIATSTPGPTSTCTCPRGPSPRTGRRRASPCAPGWSRRCCACRCGKDVAMTGEITLRGRVLAIGGLKEKILAAHRSGITHGDHAQGERQGPARHPQAGAEGDAAGAGRAHGRGAARGAGAAERRTSSSRSRRCRSTGGCRSNAASATRPARARASRSPARCRRLHLRPPHPPLSPPRPCRPPSPPPRATTKRAKIRKELAASDRAVDRRLLAGVGCDDPGTGIWAGIDTRIRGLQAPGSDLGIDTAIDEIGDAVAVDIGQGGAEHDVQALDTLERAHAPHPGCRRR